MGVLWLVQLLLLATKWLITKTAYRPGLLSLLTA